MAKYIILDTETTGTQEHDRIIELGYMVLEGAKTEVYNEFCSSETPISFEAMEVHHITPDMLQNKPTCKDTQAYKMLSSLNNEENYLIIHNAPFDLSMLQKEGFEPKMKLIDTLRCAKHIYEDESFFRLQYFRYKMGLYKKEESEARKLGIEVKAHDAIGDVLTLKLFLSHLRQSVQEKFPSENPVEKMVALTKEPIFIKTFRFGKHNGKTLHDVAAQDAGYLRWMLTSMENLDPDLRFSVQQVLQD